MGVDPYARSADASRIVQARLPICAAIVTQFVTHFGATSAPVRVSLAIADPTPTPGADAQSVSANLARIADHARSESAAPGS
jgi:hypothetical protein